MASVLQKRRMMRSAKRVVRRRTGRWQSSGNPPINLRRISVGTGNYNIYRVTRTADYGTINISATDPVLGGQSFKLSDLPAPTDITNFFDQYRIVAIKCIFIPNTPINMQEGSTTALVNAPNLMTVIDNDDDTAPGSTSLLLQFDSLHHHGNCTNGKWVRYLRPSVDTAV